MGRIAVVSFLLLLGLAGCSTSRETEPARTATEQLLISTAVDRALDRMNLKIPEGTKIWVDAENFEGYDQKYAVGAIRDRLMREGGAWSPIAARPMQSSRFAPARSRPIPTPC